MLARSPINQKATGSKIPYLHEGSNETGTDYAKTKQKSFKT